MRLCWLATALAGVIGCGDDGGAEAPDADVSPDAGISTIRGTVTTTFHPVGDAESISYDISELEIGAFRWGDDDQLHTYTGSGTAQGKFSIPDVPETRCVVRIGDSMHLATTHRDLDLGDDYPGRADIIFPLDGTSLLFDVDGMNPWNAEDELVLYSAGPGIAARFLELDGVPELAVDDSALIGWEVPWRYWPIMERAHDDRAQLVHYVDYRETLGGFYVRKAHEVFEPAAFDQTNGSPTPLTGSFTPVPTTASIHLEWALSTFTARQIVIHPSASPPLLANLGLYAQPGGVVPGFFGYPNGPYVLEASRFPITTNLDFGDVEYGNPFPTDWPLFVVASTVHAAYLTDALETFSVFAFGELVYSADLDTYGEGPVVLQVSPPTDLRVDGKSLLGYPGAVGTTPELTWLAPLNATGYGVRLYHVVVSGDEGDSDYLAQFYTAEPRLHIPPNLLTEGEYYYVVVRAFYIPDYDVSEAPFRRPLTFGHADAISNLFQP